MRAPPPGDSASASDTANLQQCVAFGLRGGSGGEGRGCASIVRTGLDFFVSHLESFTGMFRGLRTYKSGYMFESWSAPQRLDTMLLLS